MFAKAAAILHKDLLAIKKRNTQHVKLSIETLRFAFYALRYRPLHVGARFCKKAHMPSCASAKVALNDMTSLA